MPLPLLMLVSLSSNTIGAKVGEGVFLALSGNCAEIRLNGVRKEEKSKYEDGRRSSSTWREA